MYEINGVLYAGNPAPGMKVASAKVVNDLSMLVQFSTGETRLFDASPLIDLPVFGPLAVSEVFDSFKIDHGVVCWLDGEIDIAPEKMYAMSYAYDCVA